MTVERDHDDGSATSGLDVRMRRLIADGAFDLPAPGGGHTAVRLRRLVAISAHDLALGRLAEAHLDAISILREAGRTPVAGCLYGVWASEAPGAQLHLTSTSSGTVVRGSKAFCTGVGLVGRALVTARAEPEHAPRGNERVFLVDLDARDPSWVVDPGGWSTQAFAETNTATVHLDDVTIDDAQVIGPPGWYLDRVGFWHGALAPAACWAGGAMGLADHCRATGRGRDLDEHTLAHLGVIDSARWELDLALGAAGAAIDAAPHDAGEAQHTAARARTVIERAVVLVVDRAMSAFGPRLLAQDEWAARRIAELQLYVRQHHGARDHATLGRLSLACPAERADRARS